VSESTLRPVNHDGLISAGKAERNVFLAAVFSYCYTLSDIV